MIDEAYVPYLSDEDKEQYNIPHVDEIQQALMEDKEWLRLEAERVQQELLEQALWLEAEAQLERGS
jgi:hypothetical protein